MMHDMNSGYYITSAAEKSSATVIPLSNLNGSATFGMLFCL
jgi:hypothetical protein